MRHVEMKEPNIRDMVRHLPGNPEGHPEHFAPPQVREEFQMSQERSDNIDRELNRLLKFNSPLELIAQHIRALSYETAMELAEITAKVCPEWGAPEHIAAVFNRLAKEIQAVND